MLSEKSNQGRKMVSYSISRILFGVFVANVGAGLAYAQIADTQPITTFSTVQFSEVSPPELTLKMALN